MASQGIDSRISELRDFISYFAPGNIVEYGSFIHKKQPFRNYFEESKYMNSSRNSGYRPYEKGYDRRYQPTRDKKPKPSTCFNSSGESTPEDVNDSPRSTSESISSPDSNPNPTPRDTDSLPLSPNLDVVKMQLEALSRIPSPIDDRLPPVDGFKLNQTGINTAFKDIVGLESPLTGRVGGKTVRPPMGDVIPRAMKGGKGVPVAKSRPTYGGKGTQRPVTSGKQIPYHGRKMSLSSEDESDVSSCSDSGESTDSSDEEISIGTIPLQRSESVKCAVEQPMVQEEDEDTIVVDDLDIETEGNVPSRISQHFGGFTSNIPIADNAVIPVPMYQKGNVKHKNPGDKRVINSVSKSALSSPAPLKKSLVVKLKLPKLRQLKPHRSLIVKLQLPTGTNMKKRPMPFEDRQPASKSHRKMCLPEATAMKHELSASSEVQQSNKSLSHHQQAAQMKLEAEKLFARGDDHQGRAIAMLTHSLFHQILHFCDLERNKEELEVVCDFASKIRVFIEDVIEKHVSFGNLGIAGLLMKVESILTFRALNLQSHLIKAKTAEMKSQNLKISGNYLNTVHKFTDDFQSVTKKWQDAECFLSRDAILVPAARDSLSLFTPLSHIVEVSKTAVPL